MAKKKQVISEEHKAKLRENAAKARAAKAAKATNEEQGAVVKQERQQQQVTADQIRKDIYNTWNDVDGPAKLRQLAEKNFTAFLRLMLGVMPKASDVNINVRRMSDTELQTKLESILSDKVLRRLGYVPVGGSKVIEAEPVETPALPLPTEVVTATDPVDS